jgi:hypothetical protein
MSFASVTYKIMTQQQRIVCVSYSEAKIEMTVASSNKILKAISGQLISNYSKRPTTSNSDPWSAKLATVTVMLTRQSAGMTTVHTVLQKLANWKRHYIHDVLAMSLEFSDNVSATMTARMVEL